MSFSLKKQTFGSFKAILNLNFLLHVICDCHPHTWGSANLINKPSSFFAKFMDKTLNMTESGKTVEFDMCMEV